MTAQPIGEEGPPPILPAAIVGRLSEDRRRQFLAEYRKAMAAAHRDVERFGDVYELLRTWQLRAEAYSAADFDERLREVLDGEGDYVSMDALVADRTPR